MYEHILQNFNSLLPSMAGSCMVLVVVWGTFRYMMAADNKKAAGLILMLFLGPIREELVFRLPVLLFAGVFSTNAYVILITSVLFGCIHFRHSPLTNEHNMKRLQDKFPEFVGPNFKFRARVVTVVVTGLLGALFAIIALKTNSIVVPMLCHIVWNGVIGPILGTIVAMVYAVVILCISERSSR